MVLGIPGLVGLTTTSIPDVLEELAKTLQIVADPPPSLGPLEPGQVINLKIAPRPPELNFTDILQGVQVPAPIGVPMPVEIKVELEVDWNAHVKPQGLPPEPPRIPKPDPAPTHVTQHVGHAPEASFLFRPDVLVEHAGSVTGLPVPTVFIVSAKVTLIVQVLKDDLNQEIRSGPHQLLDLQVPVLPLTVPTVLAAFEHPLYDGFAMLFVPPDSPVYAPTELERTLSRLQSTVASLRSFASFAGFLLGLQELTNALPVERPVIFFKRDNVRHLNRVRVRRHEFFGNDWLAKDSTADEKISSLIFIGKEGLQAECFTGKGCTGDRLILTTGAESCVVVPNLNLQSMTSFPANGGELEAKPPNLPMKHFNDSISSIRFGPA